MHGVEVGVHTQRGIGSPWQTVLRSCATNSHVLMMGGVRFRCREAYTTTGYSPVLAFDVDDLQGTLTRLIQLGGRMDGAIQYAQDVKVRGCGAVLERVQLPVVIMTTVPCGSSIAMVVGVRSSRLTGTCCVFSAQIASVRGPDGHMVSLVEE